MKKSLNATYSDIRAAIAFIMRNERGLNKHTITEAALAATKEVGLFINTAEFTWTAPFVALVGAVVTLVANRVFDLETAQRFLEWIGIRMPAAASRLK